MLTTSTSWPQRFAGNVVGAGPLSGTFAGSKGPLSRSFQRWKGTVPPGSPSDVAIAGDAGAIPALLATLRDLLDAGGGDDGGDDDGNDDRHDMAESLFDVDGLSRKDVEKLRKVFPWYDEKQGGNNEEESESLQSSTARPPPTSRRARVSGSTRRWSRPTCVA